ncbi:MAG: DNA repair protein RecO [Oligoflexia bacterium]|nr:DNA repair protein RecO [Oligoflexia bacterium]
MEAKGKAFILRVIVAQEADVMVRLLSDQGEAITAFARAGLKSRRRFGGALQPFLHVHYRLSKFGRREVPILEEVLVKSEFSKITEDFDKLIQASYLCELVEKTTREGLANPEIYNLFGAALKALDFGLFAEGVIAQFEIKLLSILGWLPVIKGCNLCGNNTERLSLDPHQGVVLCADCGHHPFEVTSEMVQMIQRCLNTSILKSDLNKLTASRVSQLAQTFLRTHGGIKDFKSVKFKKSARLT